MNREGQGATAGRALADQLGRVGLWTRQLDTQPTEQVRTAVAELEALGWGSLWFWEVFGREALTNAALLLGATKRMVIASGIANIWARDPLAMAAAQRTLSEAYPGRFVLGVGVSHAPIVEARGHRYQRPLAKMRAYLDAMDAAPWQGPPPPEAPRVLAALGPRMLELAAERAAGALTYNTPPETTAAARSVLGPGPLLAVEQAVLLEQDPAAARRIGREFIAFYLPLPNYTRAWDRAGFGPQERAEGGSDRMVDAVVAWGGPEAIAERVRAHLDAGADHVCLQVLDPDPNGVPLAGWRTLAPTLLGAEANVPPVNDAPSSWSARPAATS
jgi:probable F420-dependent oxidoreductase